MKLTPEERRKIYEEEKAKIEAGEKETNSAAASTTNLDQNIAGLLCYVGVWISGIIMLVLEQKNQFVRFHAMQSIVTFGFLTIASILLSWIPLLGDIFGALIGILALVLWIILMVKAYQGERFKLPVAGDIAEGALPAVKTGEKTVTRETTEEKPEEKPKAKSRKKAAESGGTKAAAVAGGAATTIAVSAVKEEPSKPEKDNYAAKKAGRIASYSGSIFWNILLLVFFIFFYQYIAWYQAGTGGSTTVLPFFTNEFFIWQPILIVALIISIAANIILIIYDKFWLYETIQVILCIIGIVVVVNLLTIFPFDFTVIPDIRAVYTVPMVLRIVLIIAAIGLGIAALVHFIKLIVGISGKSAD
jgi:uncharacterized membrane protein